MDFKDYYSTLGVAKTATEKEIKQAYRKLARKHHPDVNPGDKAAEARFKDLTEAYEVLGDPAKRKKYDELGANWRAYEQAGAGQGFDPRQSGAWNANFGGGGQTGYRTMTQEEMNEMFGGENPFSDFFQTVLRAAAGSAARSRAAAAGAPAGRVPDATSRTKSSSASRMPTTARCGGCRSSMMATLARSTCAFRPGVGEGSRVRISGEGEQGSGGGQSGDLYLRVRLAPHPRFERKGRDLYTHVPVPLTTAVLGGEVEVPTLSAKTLRLKIPPNTQNGQVFRLKGHGMPVTGKSGEHGDLYATVDVELPKTLTPEQRKHFEALKELEKGASHSAV
jgi:DnaJ-class molecular chaperone